MRLLPFELRGPGGRSRHVGALMGRDADAGVIVDVTAAACCRLAHRGASTSSAHRIAEGLVPSAMLAFVEGGPVTLEAARDAVDWVLDEGHETDPTGAQLRYAVADVTRLPALPDAPLLRDFMAFEQHLRNVYPRLGRDIPPEWYNLPVYYKGNVSALGAHGDDVAIPSYADALDMEFEIAAVIGPGGTNITEERALRHIYGWTVYNDFSARTIQSQEMTVGLGPAKGKDFLGGHVLGPCLVTADEVPDPYGIALTSRVNGETWTTGSTGDMHWRWEQMIAHASRGELVRTGEIFGSGTVAGGSGMEQDRTLAAGDVIELEADALGVLRNRIVRS